MSKSKRLRARDLRKVYLLLGECCEVGADPLAWRRHVAEQLPALFGGQMGQHFDNVVLAPAFRDPFWLYPQAVVDYGWATESDRKPLEALLATGRPEEGPHVTPDVLKRRLKIVHWSGQHGRTAWLESKFFNDYVKHTHLDDGIFAHFHVEPGQMRWMFVNRALGDRPFTQRDCRLMAVVNVEFARLLGRRLARIGEPSVTDLPARQRDVLICLMNGDSEKQAALRLGLSRHTVHDHVKRLHSRFGVASRGELLARCRAFWPVLEREAPDGNGLNGASHTGISGRKKRRKPN
jgi:DNA-binding CsgD family transcriptional regulator